MVFGLCSHFAEVKATENSLTILGSKLGTLFYGDSLCASFNSAYMILGIPSEIYTYGTQFYIMIFGTGIGVYIAGEIWIPVLYK